MYTPYARTDEFDELSDALRDCARQSAAPAARAWLTAGCPDRFDTRTAAAVLQADDLLIAARLGIVGEPQPVAEPAN